MEPLLTVDARGPSRDDARWRARGDTLARCEGILRGALLKEGSGARVELKACLLDALADAGETLVISGNGDVIEPDDGLAAIGSGGSYALAAARALLAAVIVAFAGFFWYPLKRLIKGNNDEILEEDALEQNVQDGDIKEQ